MPTTVRLDPEIERRIDKLSKNGHTKAYLLRELVARSLVDVEDCQEAAAAIERIRIGEVKTISAEHLSKDLGLDD